MGLEDGVRLFAVPIFGLIAYRDLKFRRVPDRVWYPLIGLGILTLGYDTLTILNATAAQQRLFFVQTGLSLGFVGVLAVGFYLLGIIDTTIAKAIGTIGLLYPHYPLYPILPNQFPLATATHELLSLTIISNAAIVSILYPLAYLLWNLIHGRLAPVMAVGTPVPANELADRHGRLLETTAGYTIRGVDIEIVNEYLKRREITIPLLAQRTEALRNLDVHHDNLRAREKASNDPWGAKEFLNNLDKEFQISPGTLRKTLDLIATRETVWVSANFPFIVPLVVGLVIALTLGDLPAFLAPVLRP